MAENEAIKWYVVHTYSGYENKVKDSLEKSVVSNRMEHQITEVRIPVEEVVEVKNKKSRTVQRKLLPGYVLVKMEMTNETWFVVRNTRGVTGFVGAGNKPTPLSETDFANLINMTEPVKTDLEVGDTVRILAGLFETFSGKVIAIHPQTGRVTVSVTMFNNNTENNVELNRDEVIPESGVAE